MTRLAVMLACALVCAVVALHGHQASPPPPQQPVFRGEVNVIRLDVSVLDKDRHPMRGLTADDFRVIEDGKEQRIVSVAEADTNERDLPPNAWMKHTPSTVQSNDLSNELGDGRLFAIVLDDFNIPYDSTDIVMQTREAARYIVDSLGPSDRAAVIYTQAAGRTQDFTDDRQKLFEAIDKFQPEERLFMERTPYGTGQGGGDMPYRYSSALARGTCERSQPAVPTLLTLAGRLATVPNRRKTIVFLSVGLPLSFVSRQDCPSRLEFLMKETFTIAQRANINIYGVDPAGNRGFERYLQDPLLAARRSTLMQYPRALDDGAARAVARARHDFLEIVAEYTGARAIVNTNMYGEIDEMFAEASAYYLVGYQTSNGRPDGKFRRVEVKVKRDGATVRTRSGYYAPREGELESKEEKNKPNTDELGLSGLMSATALPLRATAVPIARADAGRNAEIAVVLTVRLPVPRRPLTESLTIIRTLYDADSNPGKPTPDSVDLALTPDAGDELRYDVQQRLTLPPGRHQIRLNATSRILQKSGSVYADVDVPDLSRNPVVTTGIMLGVLPAAEVPRTDRLAAILPIVPVSAREFSASDAIVAFLRVYQGGADLLVPINVSAKVFDIAEQELMSETATLAVDAFDALRGAPYQVALPLATLTHGPYLLSITAALPSGTKVRRDLVFRVR